MASVGDGVVVYAWVGVRESDSTEVEILHGLAANSFVLADVRRHHLDRVAIERQMQAYADRHQVEVRLIACAEYDTLRVLQPRDTPPPASGGFFTRLWALLAALLPLSP